VLHLGTGTAPAAGGRTMGYPTNVVGRRVGAYIFDGVLSYVLAGIVLSLIDRDWYRTTGDEVSISPTANVTLSVLLVLFWIVQVMILEGLYGWTLGKLIMQIRVVRPLGEPPGPLRALVRYVAWIVDAFPYCLPLLGFGLILGTKTHRRVGDMLADTYVIDVVYFGRPMLFDGESVQAGAQSLRPEDLGVTREELKAAIASRPKDPIYDKSLDTYVVWNKKRERMLRFDKGTQTWVPLEQ
jgi:uncharacterized RDD family membrane protein YckC